MVKKKIFDKYQIKISVQSDGSYLAICPQVQGVYAEGKTYLDALLNVEDVLRGVLEVLGANKPSPIPKRSFSFELPNPFNFGLTS